MIKKIVAILLISGIVPEKPFTVDSKGKVTINKTTTVTTTVVGNKIIVRSNQ